MCEFKYLKTTQYFTERKGTKNNMRNKHKK